MTEVAYLSRTGEIKIPLKIRTRMGFKAGDKFAVDADGGNVVLQPIGLAGTAQLAEFIAWTKKHARQRVPKRISVVGRRSKTKRTARKTKRGSRTTGTTKARRR